MTSPETRPSGKSCDRVVVLIFAYHHDSNNIASLRVRGWIKYIDASRYDIHIISSDLHHLPASSSPLQSSVRSGLRSWIDLAIAAFMPPLYMVASNQRRTWLAGAVREGVEIIKAARANRQRCVIMASYSPLHALIAARYLCWRFRLTYWADFRDGLTFEGSGRSGQFVRLLRKCFERAALSSAGIISAVSEPISRYYAQSYPKSHVELLPNGFDPHLLEQSRVSVDDSTHDRCKTYSLGHFGRISLSDASRLGALLDFMDVFSLARSKLSVSASAQFVGELSVQESQLICKEDQLGCAVHAPVSREEAQQMMRQSDGLLLLTGDLTGTATGKIFEYLATGKRIILFSLVDNAAINILRGIGDDDFIYVRGTLSKDDAASALASCLSRPFSRSFDKLSAYDKSVQAGTVENLIDLHSNRAH